MVDILVEASDVTDEEDLWWLIRVQNRGGPAPDSEYPDFMILAEDGVILLAEDGVALTYE